VPRGMSSSTGSLIRCRGLTDEVIPIGGTNQGHTGTFSSSIKGWFPSLGPSRFRSWTLLAGELPSCQRYITAPVVGFISSSRNGTCRTRTLVIGQHQKVVGAAAVHVRVPLIILSSPDDTLKLGRQSHGFWQVPANQQVGDCR
jgi:hypothetical protein